MTAPARSLQLSGSIGLQLLPRNPWRGRAPLHPLNVLRHGLPRPGLPTAVNVWRLQNLPNLLRGLLTLWLAAVFMIPTHYGAVFLRKIGPDGQVLELGLGSLRVVTTAGVNYLAACFDNTNEPELFKYHAFGTGTNAEAIGDTTLQTELTTQYNPDNTRPTGSQAHATNTYTTVGTLSPDSGGTIAVTEHGILTQAATGGGTLLDRSVFAAVNLVAGADSLQVTYTLTLTAGG